MNVLARLRNIKTFVFDMDGVLTDGTLLVDENNKWLRTMNIKDGYALQLAIKQGYRIIVISGSDAPQVEQRLRKLGLKEVFMKILDKEEFLKTYLEEQQLSIEATLFMGDDIPDYECMLLAGFRCCPADAAVEIKKVSYYISPLAGGHGCVRDVIEKVMKLNNHWPLHTTVPAA